MKLLELYSDYFANWISDGNMISRDRISLLGIRPLFDRFLTSKYVTKVWQIAAMPVHYDNCLVQMIRTEMHEKFPEIKTLVHLYNAPVQVNTQSDAYRRQLHSVANKYYKYNEFYQSLNDDEKATGVREVDSKTGMKISIDSRTLKNIRDEYDSYSYVYDAVTADKEFHNVYMFVQASGESKSVMRRYEKAFMKLMEGEGVFTSPVRGNVGVYLENFCPASFTHTDTSRFHSMLMSQENVAAIMPNKTKGLVGGRGIMLGEDWEAKLPFMIEFTNSDTAQVIMIVGKSGCGKTFLANEIAMELTAFGIHCSVIDIKGGEWAKLSGQVKTLSIDMSGDNARFVNLMRLDDLGCTAENCVEAYESAVNNTVGLFETATNLQAEEGNKADLRSILNQAVEKVYTTSGVVKGNPDTFGITVTFRYEMVLDILTILESSKAYTDRQRQLCKLIKSRCATYFMGEGRYSAAFQNEISVGDVYNTPLVIYDFNKNRGEKLDIIDDIRVFMARCLDSRKHFIRKQHGLHQAVFYEELQRCGSMPNLIENISADVTGSRSTNLSVFLLFNAVSTFDAGVFHAIRSNITTAFVGKSNSEDIKKLVNEYDCGPIRNQMEKIRCDEIGEFDHCFAVMYDTGKDRDTLILKTVMPKSMSNSLRTRDLLEIG